MEVHENGVQLGWEGDEGLGELLVERLLAGSMTVLFEPVDLLDEGELDDIRGSEGGVLTVFDPEGQPRANVRVLEVFDTTWGEPDGRLLEGEGYDVDAVGWRNANREGLAEALAEAGHELTDDTRLVVQRVEVVDRA